MVLTLFTPLQENMTILNKYDLDGVTIVDLGFSRDHIVNYFDELKWFSIENIKTDTEYGIEHMFFLEKTE